MANAMKRSLASDPLNRTKQIVGFLMAVSSGEFDPFHPYPRQIRDAIDNCHPDKSCTETETGRGERLVFSAIHAGSQSDIETALAYWEKSFDGRDPAVSLSEDGHRCDQELFRLLIETAGEVTSDASRCLLDFSWVKNKKFSNLIHVSSLAILGHQELALEALRRVAESPDSEANANTYFFVLSDGFWQMPESIRRHPLYHEWWARPGMAELAAARRANGKPYGLPLPIREGSDNEILSVPLE